MRVRSPIPRKKARIEIIPLIDIMFFLLASFMMVSLSQTHMKGIKVSLPSSTQLPPQEIKKDTVSIRVSEGGLVYFDNVLVSSDMIGNKLSELHRANPELKVSISADKFALHGDVISVLDKARNERIEKIGYQVKVAAGEAGSPGGAPPPPPKK
jgi:biopolymer transport protein ExbD